MLKSRKRIKVLKGEKVVEAVALFYAGSRRSNFSDKLAEKVGYKPLSGLKLVPLAVHGP